MKATNRYFIIYKPFGVLSQFQDENDRPTLKSLGDFPKDVYPVGRLDMDSEGLLILTNDVRVNYKVLNPKFSHEREYWIQVEGQIDLEAIQKLERGGIEIKVNKKKHLTLPAKASVIEEPTLPERNPPIRFRQNIPTSWISLKLTEGKNRQVRKMTAKVGFPTLRLVRVAIEELRLDNMQVGETKEMNQNEIYHALFNNRY